MKEIKKKKRGTNFTLEEKKVLLDIIHKYKNIIENKNTEKKITQEKQKTWDKIEHEFNMETNGLQQKTSLQLKNLYEALKHGAKKEYSLHKDSRYLIVGESSVNKISAISKKVFSIIMDKNQLDPLENLYDSSADYNNETQTSDYSNCDEIDIKPNMGTLIVPPVQHEEIDDINLLKEPSPKKIRQLEDSSTTSFNLALRSLQEEMANMSNVCLQKLEKLEKHTQFDIELMEMRREKHKKEMELLQLQIEGQKLLNEQNYSKYNN